MAFIRLRFVDTNDNLVSRIIRGAELGCAWSHVEAVTPIDAEHPAHNYLGALMQGGIEERPASYDRTWTRQLLVDVPATDAQSAAFYAFLRSKCGLEYDQVAIAELAEGMLTGEAPNWPSSDSYICSALQTAALLAAGIIKAAPTTVRLATPRDVLCFCATVAEIGEPEVNPKTMVALLNNAQITRAVA